MKKLLLTGFEPFGGETMNPALEAVRSVRDVIGHVQIIKLQVPVVFGEAADMVRKMMDRENPDAVLCIGQAGGRDALTPERVAINVRDASMADNAGNQPQDCAVDLSGPAAYFSTLPIKRMVQAIRARDIPSRVSNTAGTYVCNDLMYAVLHHAAQKMPQVKAGFMHVPFVPEQVTNKPNMPSMPLERIVTGIEAAIAVIEKEL